ncbi:MAG: hypothetical protein R2751_06110 [Bacteroidales bacterium]
MRSHLLRFGILVFLLSACEKTEPDYPDEPVIDYKGFSFAVSTDELGNKNLYGYLQFDFVDGDGDLGMAEPDTLQVDPANLPDSLKYNFYVQVHDWKDAEFVAVPEEEGGLLKYRIPYLDKQPLKGSLELEIAYPLIVFDTVFYTFYIVDRAYHHSNTDTSEVLVLTGFDLSEL